MTLPLCKHALIATWFPLTSLIPRLIPQLLPLAQLDYNLATCPLTAIFPWKGSTHSHTVDKLQRHSKSSCERRVNNTSKETPVIQALDKIVQRYSMFIVQSHLRPKCRNVLYIPYCVQCAVFSLWSYSHSLGALLYVMLLSCSKAASSWCHSCAKTSWVFPPVLYCKLEGYAWEQDFTMLQDLVILSLYRLHHRTDAILQSESGRLLVQAWGVLRLRFDVFHL